MKKISLLLSFISFSLFVNHSAVAQCGPGEDSTPPIAVCNNITIQLDANGEASIIGDDIDGGSTDNCTIASLTPSQTDFTCDDLWTTDITISPLIITGVFDGPLTGGTPKGVELKIQEDIADLSVYGIGSANNGGGTEGEEFTFPAVSAIAGEYIYIATDAISFTSFFGFAPDYTDSAVNINGDDAIELFFNGTVIDTFGDINTDGSGETWDYLDGWAYRTNNQETNDGVFNDTNWTYSGTNAFDGEVTNATAATPFPLGTFNVTPMIIPAGPIDVTLTVTDDEGNTNTCIATVTLEDSIAPTITCIVDQTENADGNCEFIVPDYISQATIIDNCSIASTMQTPAAGTIVNTGITIVEILVSDGTNTASCDFNLTVANTATPIVTCPDDQTAIGDATCMFTIPDYTGLATISNDCDGIATISQSPVVGTQVALGDTTVTLTVTDGTNSSDCTFNLSVLDGVAPIALCQNITVQLDENGEATITADDIDGGSSDFCGDITLSASQTTFTCDDVAIPVVPPAPLLITGVYDGPLTGGAPKGIELKVQEDITDLSVYGIGSANNGFGSDGEEFTFPVVAATAGDFIYITNSTDGFTEFFGFAPSYEDASAAINGDDAIELFFNGEVIDTYGDINTDGTGEAWDYLDGWAYRIDVQEANGGVFDANNWTYSGVDALDNETTNGTAVTPFPIGTFAIAPFGTGMIDVTLTVTDEDGNTSTCIAVVTVEDNIAPMITCPGDQTGFVFETCEFEVPDYSDLATITDNCTTNTTITQTPAVGTLISTGITVVEIVVTDGTNTVSCEFNLTIVDVIPPTITCPDNQIESADENCEFVLPDYTTLATVTDNCTDVVITQTPALGEIIPLGTSTITITASDGTNTESCTFDITVNDTTAPTVVCQNIDVTLDATGMATITVDDIDGGSMDNCGTVTTSIDIDTFDCTNVGANEVILTVVDDSGNTSMCTAIVTVIDDSAPSVTCQDITVTLNNDGIATITAADLDGGSTDNCGIADMSIDIDTFDCTAIGDNTVTLTVTSNTGNTSTCTATVTVNEIVFTPSAICQNITVPLLPTGTATISASAIDAGSTGAGCVDGLTIDIDTFDCSNIGTPVEVTLTVTNAAGDTDSCVAFVNVVDDLAPEIFCPEDQEISVEIPYSLPDYFANGQAVATDNCTLTFSQDPMPGTPMQPGIYTITLNAQDSSGFGDECTFELIINELLGTEDPQVALTTIALTPNPTTDKVVVSNPQLVDIENVSIYDLHGRLILQKVIGTVEATTIDVSVLQSATYMVVINSNQGHITKRLMIE